MSEPLPERIVTLPLGLSYVQIPPASLSFQQGLQGLFAACFSSDRSEQSTDKFIYILIFHSRAYHCRKMPPEVVFSATV